ncbi:uncharacterized protein UV8b_05491 [Ustilaginoidea virens]|uniref:Calcineurin-like phosphoesterase domain-containing protein n=1 Tax=Ustilaginoidea virens TaxID=1159556 RepID=A0A063C348_USTVR|nr:uncharacterized protein UV8b_05491 [Ustilaginoidea virens]QUC21248.1 hypothetical protein UV8b_05491 [Ustilaginoidea virens]GAO17229.1 hypothetical protein UVI_02057340 [Ustilaginoidea virens]
MKAILKSILTRHYSSSQVKIQILSDLHLEVGQQYSSFTFPARAPFLLLGGDIGRLIDYDGYLKFLESQACRFQKVFLVLGNHEFYGLEYLSGLEQARRLVQEPTILDTVVLLNRSRWDDPVSGLTIIGCTLWSHISEDVRHLVESRINDFKKIQGWTSGRHNDTHAEEAAWLHDQVTHAAAAGDGARDARKILVATHHAPCVQGSSRPQDSGNPWTCAFATDLLGQRDWSRVRLWVFGHTHHSTDMVRNGVRLVANQRGYVLPGSAADEAGGKTRRGLGGFDPGKVVAL